MTWDPPADLSWGGKQAVLRQVFDHYRPQFVVETGLWNGQGSCPQFIGECVAVIGIEIRPDFCSSARANHPELIVLEGDARAWMPTLLEQMPASCRTMFWLDAHLVAESNEENDSSLYEELAAIEAWDGCRWSVILIDDVRMMGREGWPTLERVLAWAERLGHWTVRVEQDIVKMFPHV